MSRQYSEAVKDKGIKANRYQVYRVIKRVEIFSCFHGTAGVVLSAATSLAGSIIRFSGANGYSWG